jgi:hypothetical protein
MDVKALLIAGAHSPIAGRRGRFEKAAGLGQHSRNLWKLQHVPVRALAKRTWSSMIADRLFGHAAELGFYLFLVSDLVERQLDPRIGCPLGAPVL